MVDSEVVFYFLQEDMDWLETEIERVRGLIHGAKELSRESTEQSSESWHDNYNFEEAQRQLKMYFNILGGLSRAKENSQIVSCPTDPTEVTVGTKVRFTQQAMSGTGNSGPSFEDEFSIGSYMVSDALRDLDFISYETPIGAALLGAKLGETRMVRIGGTDQVLTVLQIQAVILNR